MKSHVNTLLVFDIYRTKNAKSQTRASQEKSISVSVKGNTFYKDLNVFMRRKKNEMELFQMIGKYSTSYRIL